MKKVVPFTCHFNQVLWYNYWITQSNGNFIKIIVHKMNISFSWSEPPFHSSNSVTNRMGTSVTTAWILLLSTWLDQIKLAILAERVAIIAHLLWNGPWSPWTYLTVSHEAFLFLWFLDLKHDLLTNHNSFTAVPLEVSGRMNAQTSRFCQLEVRNDLSNYCALPGQYSLCSHSN